MELILAILFGISFFGIYFSSPSRTEGIVKAWIAIYTQATVFKILLTYFPGDAAKTSQWILIGFSGFAVFLALRKFRAHRLVIPFWVWPLLAIGAVVMVRSVFPQFDTDSNLYHLFTLKWLEARSGLPLIHQFNENFVVNVRFIGLEEFSAVPGLNLDLALYAGLLGGMFKVFTFITLFSLIPIQWPLLHYCAAYLLFIDDHFLFSGHSRHVYLTPSFMGQLALFYHLGWRFFKGRITLFWPTAIIALGLIGTKYHGVVFVGLLSPLIAWRVYQIRKIPTLQSKWIFGLVSSVLLVLVYYGVNFYETGTPFYPYNLGPFKPTHFPVDADWVNSNLWKGAFWEDLKNPLKLIIYPGNMALKIEALILVPVLLLYGLRISGRFKNKIQLRHFGFALFVMGVGLFWQIYVNYQIYHESRWLRFHYVLMITVLIGLAVDFRKCIPNRIFKNSLFCRNNQVTFGFFLMAWLTFNIDRRYYNVPQGERPTWSAIGQFFRASLGLRPYALENRVTSWSLDQPMVRPLLRPASIEIYADQTEACLQKLYLEFPDTDPRLRQGVGALVFSPEFDWPANLILPFAVRGDVFGARLRLPEGAPQEARSISEAGIEWVFYPRQWVQEGIRAAELNRPLEAEFLREMIKLPPYCVTERLAMVRVPKGVQ